MLQRIVVLAVVIHVLAGYASGCHNGLFYGRKKRDLTSISTYFSKCLVSKDSSLPDLVGSVNSVVGFIVDESQWYASASAKCNQKDLSLETSCWQEKVKFLILHGSPFNVPTKNCICKYAGNPPSCKGSGKGKKAIKSKKKQEHVLDEQFSSCLGTNFKLKNKKTSQYKLSSVTRFLTGHSAYTSEKGDRVDNINRVYEKTLKSKSRYRIPLQSCKKRLLKYRKRIYEPYSLSNWSKCSVLCGKGVQTRKRTCKAFACQMKKGQAVSRSCYGKYPKNFSCRTSGK